VAVEQGDQFFQFSAIGCLALAIQAVFEQRQREAGMFSLTGEELHRRIHDRLPADIREVAFEVDVAALDARLA